MLRSSLFFSRIKVGELLYDLFSFKNFKSLFSAISKSVAILDRRCSTKTLFSVAFVLDNSLEKLATDKKILFDICSAKSGYFFIVMLIVFNVVILSYEKLILPNNLSLTY